MKRILRSLAIAMLCGSLIAPVAQASERGRHPGSSQQRPGGPGGGPGNRPGGGGPGQHPGNRPGGGGPGHNPGNRPGGGGPGHNPGGPGGPGCRPNNRPGGPGFGPGYFAPPPIRPHRPVVYGWYRPTPPPPAWRPGPVVPSFNAILGIALGSTLNYTVNALLNSGYYVDGYADNMLYLRDINQLGYYWPDATMYYNNVGGLAGSQFYYSTPYNDPARYNAVYNTLLAQYGPPVVRNGSAYTWYGNNGLFISLNYDSRAVAGGGTRFFTTLTFGN